MSSSFKPLTNISTNFPPEVGDSVLWRGVKIGPHGQPSTKCEYFNAKLRHKAVDSDNEFLVLRGPIGGEGSETRPPIIFGVPTDSWVVADGGRCYKEADVCDNFIEMVRCPDCTIRERWFNSEQAYCQHWNTVHKCG